MICFAAPKSANGRINVTWDYSHTGGLDLTRVAIEYRQKEESAFQTLRDPNLDLEKTNFEILNITAGYTYIFQISATNNNGSASIECPSVLHMIGMEINTQLAINLSIDVGMSINRYW